MSEGAKEIIQEMAEFIPDLEESDRRELGSVAGCEQGIRLCDRNRDAGHPALSERR